MASEDWTRLGKHLDASGDYPKALIAFYKAVECDNSSLERWNDLAHAFDISCSPTQTPY